MTSESRADYLKKYLSGGSESEISAKKKKSKKTKLNGSGISIVEEDAFRAVGSMARPDLDSDMEEEIQIEAEIKRKVDSTRAKFNRNAFAEVEPALKKEPESRSPSPPPRQRRDSDTSPPRRQPRRDSPDAAPTRRKRRDSDASPPRKGRDSSPPRRTRRDSDASPPRRSKGGRRDSPSPPRKRQRWDSDASPPRRGKDLSPRRRKDASPPRRHRRDSDASPPRRTRDALPPPRRQRRDSDASPPRRGRVASPPRRQRRDSDASPPRRPVRRDDDDASPPRRPARGGDDRSGRRAASPVRVKEEEMDEDEEGGTMTRTLDGKKAGLQSAADLRDEGAEMRKRELEMFTNLAAEISGRGADTVQRQKMVGKRDKPEDKEKKDREAAKQAELTEIYKAKWNKGAAQQERRAAQLEEMARVAAEPWARAKDDEAMNEHLKEEINVKDDPMASFILKKRRKVDIREGRLVYPQCPHAGPPNRYGIEPGYRWDGVVRGNGFEGQLALAENKRRADESEHFQYVQAYE